MSEAVQRIVAVIEEETARLRADPLFGVSATSLVKHRLLLDLDRLAPEQVPPDRLETLRLALADNTRELGAQLDAMRRRTALAVSALRNNGHDGTYGVSGRGNGRSGNAALRRRWTASDP